MFSKKEQDFKILNSSKTKIATFAVNGLFIIYTVKIFYGSFERKYLEKIRLQKMLDWSFFLF